MQELSVHLQFQEPKINIVVNIENDRTIDVLTLQKEWTKDLMFLGALVLDGRYYLVRSKSFFFFFFFWASEGLYYSLHIFMLYNDNQLHHYTLYSLSSLFVQNDISNNILGKYILSRSFHMISHNKKASELQKRIVWALKMWVGGGLG